MAADEHLKTLLSGCDAWNAWRQRSPQTVPDLTGIALEGNQLGRLRLSFADLSLSTLKKVNLRGADCWQTSLNVADLSGSDLGRAFFGHALLHQANLSGTKLYATRFFRCDLSGADFSHARMFQTEFFDSDLDGADFSYAWVKQSIFSNVDLSGVKGLDTVKFIGPSTLGVDSVYKSKGHLPISFLRGCGVPEDFVRLIPTLRFGNSLQLSCFLCHHNLDRVFCEHLSEDLRANGVRCWFFQNEFAAGREVFEAKTASQEYERLLVICSKNSLADPVVCAEIDRALSLQDQLQRPVLYCVTRDDFLADTWTHPRKTDVLNAVVSDFRHWERPDSYARGLGKLMGALQRA
jgi:uncharacterized protein YjbI with pentapeptide repeats